MSHYGNGNGNDHDERNDGTLFVAAGLTPSAAAATSNDSAGLSSTLSSSLHRFMASSANNHRRMAVSTHDDRGDDDDDDDDDDAEDNEDEFRNEDDVEASNPRGVTHQRQGQSNDGPQGRVQSLASLSPQRQVRYSRCLYFFVMLAATLASFLTMETCHFMTTTHLVQDDEGDAATAVGLYRFYSPAMESCVAYTTSTLPAPSSRVSQITALFAFVGGILVVVGVLGGCALGTAVRGAPPDWTRPVSLALPFLQVMTLMLLLDSSYCRASTDDSKGDRDDGDKSEMCAMNRGSWIAIVASILYAWASLLLMYWINQPAASAEADASPMMSERINGEEGGEQLNGGRIAFEDIPYNPPPRLSTPEELQQEIAKVLSIKKIEAATPSTSRNDNSFASTLSAIFGSSSTNRRSPMQNQEENSTTESDEDEVVTSSIRTDVTTLLAEEEQDAEDQNDKHKHKRSPGKDAEDLERYEHEQQTVDDTVNQVGEIAIRKSEETTPQQELAVRADRPISKGDDDDAVCAICMVEYEEGDEVCFSSHCPHTFHRDCMIPWLVRQRQRRQEILWNHYREHYGTEEAPDLPESEGNECPICRQCFLSTTTTDNKDLVRSKP